MAEAVKNITGVWAFPIFRENFIPLLTDSIKRLPTYYTQYVSLFDVFFPNRVPYWITAVAALCVWAVSIFTPERRRVLAIVGLVVLANFIIYFITTKYGFWHMVELYPFLAVATVLGLRGLRERLPRKAGTAVFALGVVFFAAIGVAETARFYVSVKDYDYDSFVARAARKIDGRVLAVDFYAPAVEDGNLVTPWFSTDRPYTNCPPFGRKVEELKVDYIIADDVFRTLSRKACGPYYEQAMLQYLDLHCEAVDWVPLEYPSYWAPGGTISGIYVYGVQRQALQ